MRNCYLLEEDSYGCGEFCPIKVFLDEDVARSAASKLEREARDNHLDHNYIVYTLELV